MNKYDWKIKTLAKVLTQIAANELSRIKTFMVIKAWTHC